MRFSLRVWAISLSIVLIGSHAGAIDDVIQQATFAPDFRISNPVFDGRRTAGFNVYDLTGWGLNLNYALGSSRTVWAHFNHREYSLNANLSMGLRLDSPAFFNEKNKYQVVVGMDQMLHPIPTLYWGFIVGLGVGISKSDYEVEHYRKVCTFMCGYDRSDPVVQNQQDIYGFISARLGMAFREMDLLGLRGDMTVGYYPELVRTGQRPTFSSPGEVPIEVPSHVSWALEYSIEF